MKRCLIRIALQSLTAATALAMAGGCQHGQYDYKGVDMSARSFNEDPELHDYYIGVDVNFVATDEEPRRIVAPSTRPINQY